MPQRSDHPTLAHDVEKGRGVYGSHRCFSTKVMSLVPMVEKRPFAAALPCLTTHMKATVKLYPSLHGRGAVGPVLISDDAGTCMSDRLSDHKLPIRAFARREGSNPAQITAHQHRSSRSHQSDLCSSGLWYQNKSLAGLAHLEQAYGSWLAVTVRKPNTKDSMCTYVTA